MNMDGATAWWWSSNQS